MRSSKAQFVGTRRYAHTEFDIMTNIWFVSVFQISNYRLARISWIINFRSILILLPEPPFSYFETTRTSNAFILNTNSLYTQIIKPPLPIIAFSFHIHEFAKLMLLKSISFLYERLKGLSEKKVVPKILWLVGKTYTEHEN